MTFSSIEMSGGNKWQSPHTNEFSEKQRGKLAEATQAMGEEVAVGLKLAAAALENKNQSAVVGAGGAKAAPVSDGVRGSTVNIMSDEGVPGK